MRELGEKAELPSYVVDSVAEPCDAPRRRKHSRGLRVVLGVVLSLVTLQYLGLSARVWRAGEHTQLPLHASEWLEKCHLLQTPPGPPPDFHTRAVSDRVVPGTTPTLITVSCHVSGLKMTHYLLTNSILPVECHHMDRW